MVVETEHACRGQGIGRYARPDSIFVLIMPEAHVLDVAAPVQVFGHPKLNNTLRFISGRDVQTSAQGLTFGQLECLPENIPPNCWLMLPGTLAVADKLDNEDFLQARDWLRRRASGFALWAGICSGALLAGTAGLLDGRRCTTHHDLVDVLRKRVPAAQVMEDCLYVEDSSDTGSCFTSAGIATGLDLSLHLVATVWGHQAAARVARDTVLYHRRAGSDSQRSFWMAYRNHVQSRIHRIQDQIMMQPGAAWSIAILADQATLSERHLRRLFKETTGMGLHEYIDQARLELSRQLLRETGLNLDQVAERCGFGSERSLRRSWQRGADESPSKFRRRAHASIV